MQKTLFYKILMIALLSLLLLVPLIMVENTISQRQYLQRDVIEDMQSKSFSQQRLAGPIVVVQYDEAVDRQIYDDKTKETLIQTDYQARQLYLLPTQLAVEAKMNVEPRYRGIYKVQVYQSEIAITGQFNWEENLGLDPSRIRWKNTYLAMGVSDNRGLRTVPQLTWDAQNYSFKPGMPVNKLGNGLQTELKLDFTQSHQIPFHISLSLDGMQNLSFIPVGDDTRIHVEANWPHPNFMGQFLPVERHIDDQQFSANWQTSLLATNMLHELTCPDCYYDGHELPSVGVELIEPINIYVQAERSVKYAMLFILLTFTLFFLFEILKQLPVHPIQYAFVGMALALFYLLLISLSEHIAFVHAYWIAACACISLIGYYVSFVLRSWQRGGLLALLLLVLYAVLFVLIQSEDQALLMGSCVLFLMLATLMVATRKLDWYQLGKSSSKS